MTEAEMHLLSFVNYLSYTVAQPVAHATFQQATNEQHPAPEGTLESLVDQAQGENRAYLRRFVDWCAGHYGRDYLPPDFLDRIVPEAVAA